MATQEIYLRNPGETEARGPFSPQQLADLAQAEQVTSETLFYDAPSEQWLALKTNAELMAHAFPPKKSLTLKQKEIAQLNKPEVGAKAITVDDMLAAAEGRTDDTRGKEDPEIAMMRAARLGMFGAIATLALSAAATILPAADVLTAMTGAKLLEKPLVLLGLVDVALAALLGLGMTNLYPFVRFRAALGGGLLGFMYFAQGQSGALAAALAGSAGLYLATISVKLFNACFAVAAGVAGMGLLVWLTLVK
jgi:hypothetical protein